MHTTIQTSLAENKARQMDYERQDALTEESKKNHDFVQFQRSGLHALSKLNNLLAHKIFLFLSKEMDYENKIMISQSTLAEIFEVSRQTVHAAVAELVDKKLLQVLKSGASNIYCLNANVVWSSYRSNLNLAKFKATIIVSDKEQVSRDKVKRVLPKQQKLDLKA